MLGIERGNRQWFELARLGAALVVAALTIAFTWRRQLEASLSVNLAGMAFLAGAQSICSFCSREIITLTVSAGLILIGPQLFLEIRERRPAHERAIVTAAALLCSVCAAYWNYGNLRSRIAFPVEFLDWLLFAVAVSLLFSALKTEVISVLTQFHLGRYLTCHNRQRSGTT